MSQKVIGLLREAVNTLELEMAPAPGHARVQVLEKAAEVWRDRAEARDRDNRNLIKERDEWKALAQSRENLGRDLNDTVQRQAARLADLEKAVVQWEKTYETQAHFLGDARLKREALEQTITARDKTISELRIRENAQAEKLDRLRTYTQEMAKLTGVVLRARD